MIVHIYKINVFDKAWKLEECIFPVFMGTIVIEANYFIVVMQLINLNYCSVETTQKIVAKVYLRHQC